MGNEKVKKQDLTNFSNAITSHICYFHQQTAVFVEQMLASWQMNKLL